MSNNENCSINEKQENVRKFLLMPIKKCRANNKTHIVDNVIFSRKIYGRKWDADMSEVSIEFYKIIYDFIDNEILNSKGRLINEEFAGDTMCSFNTIANRTPGAGKSRKTRTSKNQWPEFLQKYYDQYHCLANFWLIPKSEGRTLNGKVKYDDFMDKYLNNLIKMYDLAFKENYFLYVEKFGSFSSFCEKHFLIGDNNYIKDKTIKIYSDGNPEEIIESMMKLIKERADSISKFKYCDKIYELYSRLRRE